MGDVVEYRSPRAREEFTAYVGMVIFLGAWAMLFCGLFLAYGLLRARAPHWPPPHQPGLPWRVPLLNSALLAASSATLHSGYGAVRAAQGRAAARRLLAATVLGAMFLAAQAALWTALRGQGLTPNSSTYGSVVYLLTGVHALHVAVGVVALGWLTLRTRQGLINAARHLGLRLWAMYWHFVGAVWAFLFVAVFLL
jgi:cytochrome c oxidase subunit 3